MLSSVLNGERAIQVNIAIMRAFVRLREVLTANKSLAKRVETLERRLRVHGSVIGDHSRQIRGVFEAIERLMAPPETPKRRIGFVAAMNAA